MQNPYSSSGPASLPSPISQMPISTVSSPNPLDPFGLLAKTGLDLNKLPSVNKSTMTTGIIIAIVIFVVIAIIVGIIIYYFVSNSDDKKDKPIVPPVIPDDKKDKPIVPPVVPDNKKNILPRQTTTLTDKGFEDNSPKIESLKYPKKGWYDVSGQGVPNDYCRAVGDSPTIFWACALAGQTDQYTRTSNSLSVFEKGPSQ